MGWQETQRKLSSLSFVLGNSKRFLVVVSVKWAKLENVWFQRLLIVAGSFVRVMSSAPSLWHNEGPALSRDWHPCWVFWSHGSPLQSFLGPFLRLLWSPLWLTTWAVFLTDMENCWSVLKWLARRSRPQSPLLGFLFPNVLLREIGNTTFSGSATSGWVSELSKLPSFFHAPGKQRGASLDTSGVLECLGISLPARLAAWALCYSTTKPFQALNKEAFVPQIFLEHLPHARLCSRHWGLSRKDKLKQETNGESSHQSGERQAANKSRMVSCVMEFSLTERSKIENSFRMW